MRQSHHRRRTGGVAACALALVLALSACSSPPLAEIDLPAQTDAALPADTAKQIQDAVSHAMAASGSPAAIVGVWAPWSGTWVEGVGTQQPAGAGAKVSADLHFKAAQVTRAMTCDVLYSLVKADKVSLDDPLPKYVAGVADLQDVTLGELCDGTAGLGSYAGQLAPTWLVKPDRTWDPRELASYGLGVDRSTAGVAYRDSDAGYVLLGLALERVTGLTASELIDRYVATPLALSATQLPAEGAKAPSAMLQGYLSQKDAAGAMNCTAPLDITSLSTTTGYTDSGVVTDIHDLGRYAQSLAANSIVPASAHRLDGALPAYPDAPSWFTARGGVYQAGSLVGQFGSVPGYSTAAFADPSTGLTVAVVLDNSGAGANIALSLAWELAAIASKAPAASGQQAPDAGLPWTAQQYHDAITASAICPLP